MAVYGTLRHPRLRRPEAVTPDPADERLVDDRDSSAFDDLMKAEAATSDLRPLTQQRVHISALATAGLITAIVALATTLTGLLAPLGIALGTVGLVMCISSLATVHRPNVTRRGLALIGLISALAAVVLAALAMSGEYAWPNSDTNEVDQLHTWLNGRWPWLERW